LRLKLIDVLPESGGRGETNHFPISYEDFISERMTEGEKITP
jgi:hypothetical protein